MHRALCAALVQQQPLGLTFLEWCPEETEQSAPSLSASALACGARKDGVPLDTPHRHVGWMKDQQHHIAAKGEAIWGNLQTLQRGTKKLPTVSILLLLPTAHHSGQPGHSAPSFCLGDSSDFTMTAAVWPEQREVSNVQSRTSPLMRKPPQGSWGKLCGAVLDKVGLGPITAASQR